MTQRELTLQDYLAMLRRRWILITIFTVLGGPLAYGISRFLPNRYTSQTLILVEQPSVPSDYVKPVDTTDISQRLASMQQQILSRTRLEPIVRQFGLYSGEINRVPMEELVGRLQKGIRVTPVLPMAQTEARNLPGFFVSVTLDNRQTAQQVCTAVTSMFIEENVRDREQHSENTTEFLAQQLTDAKAKLDERDAQLAAFESRYMGSLPDESKMNLDVLMGLTSQLDATNQALARAQQDKSFEESVLTQQIAEWQASQSGHNPQTLEQQMVALQNQLATLQAQYTDDYPDVIKAKQDIAALQKRIAQGEDEKMDAAPDDHSKTVEPQNIVGLRVQIHTLEQTIAEKTREQAELNQRIKLYQERVQSSPAIEEQYKQLTRDYQTAETFYNDLLKKRDQSAMATDLERRQQGEQFRVFDPANLPDKPSFPNRPLFALGGLGGGLTLGLGLAFLLELRDTSLKTERDVEVLLQTPVLAMIPAFEPLASKEPANAVHPRAAGRIELSARG